jgi:hypothetical protein
MVPVGSHQRWFVLSVGLIVLLTITGCPVNTPPATRTTRILHFTATPNPVPPGGVTRLAWHATDPGTTAGTASCSLSRHVQGAPNPEPPNEVACQGVADHTITANVSFQLNVLKHPYVPDAPQPYLTQSVLVTTTATPVTVGIQPTSVTLSAHQTQSFTASVSGAADTGVTWSATCGTLSGNGNTRTYSAPGSAGSCSVTATSVADASKSATATVTVTPGFEPTPSYMSISNVSLAAASGGARRVGFDISWPESWRGPSRPSWVAASDNWDAAWVFVKYRVDGGAWRHATLAGSGHVQPSGSVVSVPGDRMGAFVYRSSSGYGTFTANGVGLQWDYVADGVAADASVEVRPFGIDMVYVPEGSFSVGSGVDEHAQFRVGGTANTPFVVSSQTSIQLGDLPWELMWTDMGAAGSPSGQTHAGYPSGFGAYYAMKHELTQGQYVDFLNTLTQAQAAVRKHTASENRYAITGDSVGSYATSHPFVAMNYIAWADAAAFADWAGFRPMTELEFEKAARGPLPPVAYEFAWGSLSQSRAEGLVNTGAIDERPTPSDANMNYREHGPPGNPIDGPVRAGSFARPGDSRRDAGAGYYGSLELSGNLWELVVTVGYPEGRAYSGAHGDGALDMSGNANVGSWPDAAAIGIGVRGGSWASDLSLGNLDVSSRHRTAHAGRGNAYGWRGARSAP